METRKIAVIDLDSVCYTIGNPNKVLDEAGQPVKQDGKFVYYDKTEEELRQSADSVMRIILNNSEATHYIGYLKGTRTTRERKIINEEYKANRTAEQPKWWAFVTNDLHIRWNAKYVNDMEVDDAVNITRLELKDSFICAIDGDLLGLEGTHYNWRVNNLRGEWVTATKDQAIRKFWSDMITGQPGDNIKGIPGRGKKFAENFFIEYKSFTQSLPVAVLEEYLLKFDESEAIYEYFKNYFCLKILDKKEGFIVPEPVVYNKQMSLFS